MPQSAQSAPGRLAALLCAGAAALSACTSQAELRKAELVALSAELPGEYRNPQQSLTIRRLVAPLVGDQVFYVRETVANDARRVISERIWSLDVAADARILGAVYTLEEPERWRSGGEHPELFRSLLRRDLRQLPGCELSWAKTPQGFAGSSGERCPQSWRVEGERLSFSDPGAAAAGPDGYFHFQRVAGAE